MYQFLDIFFCFNNAWFDIPFHLCILDLINLMSTFCRSLFCWRYELDLLHWSKYLIEWTLFWSVFFDGDYTMDTILEMKKISVIFLFFSITNRCCMGKYFIFCSCWVITLEYIFGKMAPVSAMDNSILHASGLYPADKTEEGITLSLYHARLYLAESDHDWDNKSSKENTFDISCGGRGSRSSL